MADHWQAITDWYKSDPEIAVWFDGELEAIKINAQILKGWAEVGSYQGLDIKLILKKMKERHTNYVPAGTQISFMYRDAAGVEREFKYTDNEKLFKDVAMLIFIFSARGTSWEKMKKKSRKEFVDVMDLLQDKYDLNVTVRKPGTPLASEDITVSRVAACFPTVVADFFHSGLGKPLTTLAAIGLRAGTSALLCSSLPAIIPHNLQGNNRSIHALCFLVAVLNDNVIHRKDGHKTALTGIMTYYRTAFNSPGVPEQARKNWMKGKAVMTSNTEVAPAIVAAGDLAAEKIRAARPNDEDLEEVLREVEAME